MKINEHKLKRQVGIIDTWIRSTKAKGTLEACTGFGKTYTALLGIRRFQKKYPNERINIVVPSIDLLNQWNTELQKLSLELNLNVIRVYVVNTYIKNYHECTLLILDEIHRYASEEFGKTFEHTNYKFILGLTATLERIDGLHNLIEEKAPIFDSVSLNEARAEGYISNFKVFNLVVSLSKQDLEKYDKADSTFKNTFAYFNRDFEVAMNCRKGTRVPIKVGTEYIGGAEYRIRFAKQQGWTEDQGEDHFYHPKNIMSKAQQWGNAMGYRKKLLQIADSKVDVIEDIIKAFPNKKTIIFSENSEFADKVTERLGDICRSYHTKVVGRSEEQRIETVSKTGKVTVKYKQVKISKNKVLEETLKGFKEGKIRVISTVRKLDEGFDDAEIELVIMASYSSSKRQDTQRTGRGVRVDYKNKDKESIVINLYIENSQEEKWLNEKQKGKGGITNVKSVNELINFSGGLILT